MISPTRNMALDVLRVVLAGMVVAIHTSFLREVSPLTGQLAINGIFRIVVPTFILISGYYFGAKVERGEAAGWVKRLIILYFVWMLVYAPWWLSEARRDPHAMEQLLLSMFFGFRHLWYLIGVALAGACLIRMKKLSTPILVTISFALFAVGLVLQNLRLHHIIAGTFFSTPYPYRNFLFFAFPFLTFGFLIRRHALLGSVIPLRLLVAGCLIGLVGLVAESFLSYRYDRDVFGVDVYLSLLVLCPSLFLLVSRSVAKGKTQSLAQFSTAIYLVHILFALTIVHLKPALIGSLLTFDVLLLSVPTAALLVRINRAVPWLL